MPHRGDHEQQRRSAYRTARSVRTRIWLVRLVVAGSGGFIVLGLPVLIVLLTGTFFGWAVAEEQAAAACGQTASVDGAGASDTGRKLTSREIAQFAARAGFAGEDLVIAVAVAHAESSGRVAATNTNSNGSTDYGLWQINSVHRDKGFDPARALDPAYNAQWAHRVFTDAGSNWNPWTVYKKGTYREHLPAARAAAEDAGAVTVDDLARDTGHDLTDMEDCSSGTTAQGGTQSIRAGPAISFARQQIGDPYVWSATGPDSWDCSSLVQAAWATAGVRLPRVSRDQHAAVPEVEDRADIQPGDLIFYGNPVRHVVMYTGNGMIIEAPSAGLTVRERAVYWDDVRGIGRPAAY